MKRQFGALAALSCSRLAGAAHGTAPLSLWRLDCGTIDIADLGDFSDTGLFARQKRRCPPAAISSNGDRLLLWDPAWTAPSRVSEGQGGSFLKERLVTQLERIGVKPADVTYVGLSHYHYDHTGQRRTSQCDFADRQGDWEVSGLATRRAAL